MLFLLFIYSNLEKHKYYKSSIKCNIKIKEVIVLGLTASSTGSKLLQNDIEELKEKCDYTIAIAGNPNVRKIYNI